MANPAVAGTEGQEGHDHEEGLHHSKVPVILGIGAFILYLGAAFEFNPQGWPFAPGMTLGLLIVIAGIVMWAREAVSYWERGYEVPGVSPGRHVGWWGVVLFLGTEVMLFGGLFATYFVLRGENPAVWTAARAILSHSVPLVTINTIILVASGVTMHYANVAVRKDDLRKALMYLVPTFILGAIFLGVQVFGEFLNLIGEGITVQASPFGSAFYILTGTHGFHVFLGLIMIATATWRVWKGHYSGDRHVSMEGFTLYWHFVDIVWVLLFLVIYLQVI